MDPIAHWMTSLARAGGQPHPAQGRSLLSRYAEPHRRYHTVAHLTAVLSTVDELAMYAADPDVVRLAAWYHDAVYDPRRADNEERSAHVAESELAAAGLAVGSIARVARLVRLTTGHDAPAGDSDGEVLCDADLAILAAPAGDYDCYVAAVREEYGHVDEPAWRAGRGEVLTGLLDRPRLFRTTAGRAWQQAARDNLRRELTTLAGPSGDAAQPR